MKLDDFSVIVPEGNETEDGYVELRHAGRYSLRLTNDSSLRCDALVETDGKAIGNWRIAAKSFITLERPVNDTGHFTFYVAGTPEARQAGIVRNDHLGLLKVTFKPERKPIGEDESLAIPAFLRRDAGGTGLSGRSRQTFVDVDPIIHDGTEVVIHLRLVERDDITPRPLIGLSRQTPVPPLT